MADGADKPTAREIFLEIVERSPDERVAWLDEHVDDPELRAEVEELLRHHDEATAMLSEKAWMPTPDEARPHETMRLDVKRLGEFEIVRELGRGGMGLVYLAQDTLLDRRVALKILPAASAVSETAVARFLREAKAIARLNHANIVQVHEIKLIDGVHFIVMEYIEGPTLAEKLKWDREARGNGDRSIRRSRSATSRHREIALLIASIADALEHAHQHDIIHRDVKPANVLLDDRGPHLVDFGLAKDSSQLGVAKSVTVAGTPSYMSPEQASAAKIRIDHRSDVFSLGVVLYEALGFELPFSGRTAQQVLNALISKQPRRLRSIDRTVPRDLETICHMALEKEPGRRYQTAGAFAADLRAFVAGNPILARPPSAPRRVRMWAREHRVACLTGLVLTLVAVIAGLVVRADQQRRTLLCPVTISVDVPDAEISVRRVDETTLHLDPPMPLGRAPIERHLLEPGQYRFTAVAPNGDFGEATEFLTRPGEPRLVEIPIRPTADATAGMKSMSAGAYHFGRPGNDEGFDREQTLSLPAFWIDKTETSNAEYRAFVLATGHRSPSYMDDDYDPRLDPLPVVQITQRDAQLYARWAGKRLPTVFEWEAAARAPDGWLLPWSLERTEAPAGKRMTGEESRGVASYDRAFRQALYERYAVATDSLPELCTPDGLHHTFGNVGEFTSTILFDETDAEIYKGFNWTGSPLEWDLTHSRTHPIGKMSFQIGFRCARSATP